MTTRAEQLAMALDDFLQTTADVEAVAIVSVDGLTMASALPPQIEEDRLGAMAAALLSLGEKAAEGLGRGSLAQVFVEGEHGFVFLMAAGDAAVLAAITAPSCKIGLVLYDMRNACQRIAAVLDQPVAPVAELRAAPDLLA